MIAVVLQQAVMGPTHLRGRQALRRLKVGDLALSTLGDPSAACSLRCTSHDRVFEFVFATSEMRGPGYHRCPASSSSLDGSAASHRPRQAHDLTLDAGNRALVCSSTSSLNPQQLWTVGCRGSDTCSPPTNRGVDFAGRPAAAAGWACDWYKNARSSD
jgi:hypothetical protein